MRPQEIPVNVYDATDALVVVAPAGRAARDTSDHGADLCERRSLRDGGARKADSRSAQSRRLLLEAAHRFEDVTESPHPLDDVGGLETQRHRRYVLIKTNGRRRLMRRLDPPR
jgi:hypothetical protein